MLWKTLYFIGRSAFATSFNTKGDFKKINNQKFENLTSEKMSVSHQSTELSNHQLLRSGQLYFFCIPGSSEILKRHSFDFLRQNENILVIRGLDRQIDRQIDRYIDRYIDIILIYL